MFKKILTIFISILFAILIIEVLLRAINIMPFAYNNTNDTFSGKNIFKEDSDLGWISSQGVYLVNPNFKLSIDENGKRETGLVKENTDKIIVTIGGSFAQGWGVNDDETFTAKLEKKFPNIKVYNYSQGGYGTIQSLILLKRIIQKNKIPKLIIYGFIDHHEFRNAARMSWMRMLSTFSKNKKVKLPYGFIDENSELILKPPVSNPKFPLSNKLSIITLLEKAYIKNMTKKHFPNDKTRKKQQQMITQKAILEMKNLSDSFNANFLVLILHAENKKKIDFYENFFKKNKINSVNCFVPLVDEMVLIGDYHPSPKAHSHYSSCLSNYIKKRKIIF